MAGTWRSSLQGLVLDLTHTVGSRPHRRLQEGGLAVSLHEGQKATSLFLDRYLARSSTETSTE
jgi:hypothetical protein